MPIYEYRCSDCGTLSEFLVPRAGATPADLRCGSCRGTRMSKVLSTMAVQGTAAAPSCPTGTCPLSAQGACDPRNPGRCPLG